MHTLVVGQALTGFQASAEVVRSRSPIGPGHVQR
jgi:hypothetical protein